jgi:hypothetical protein
VNKIRIVFPLGNQYYMESPWVDVKGDRSREVTSGQPRFLDKNFVEEEVQKGNLIIDPSMSMQDCYQATMTSVRPSGQSGVEYGQIKVNVKAAEESVATFTVGLGSQLPANIPGAVHSTGSVTVTGTYGGNTLKAIGDLARLNTIGITRIHYEASNESVYGTSPVLTTVTSVNGSGTAHLNFPQSDSDDENVKIRDMKPDYFKSQGFEGGLRFNGMNYLTYSLPAKENLTLTFYTVFTPK